MAPVFASRSHAEEFAALVEGTSTDVGERYARLLEVVGQLQAVPALAPSPEFAADLRARLLIEADTLLVPVPARARADTDRPLTLRPRRTSRERRVATVLGSLAVVGAAAAMTVGAEVALPGDTLYPVKRAIEDVRTEIAVGDEGAGTVLLAHASDRLDETAALTRRVELDVPATETGLRDFTWQATGGAELLTSAYVDDGEPATIARLRDFTGESMEELAALEPALPAEARDELYAAADAMIAIDDDAAATCRACGGVGIDTLPPNLVASIPPPVGPDVVPGSDVREGDGDGQVDLPGPLAPLPTDDPSSLPTPTRVPVPSGSPTDPVPTSRVPTVPVPTGPVPTGPVPTTPVPTTPVPTASVPTASVPTASVPTASVPTASLPTESPPTVEPSTPTVPSPSVTLTLPTVVPTVVPTALPTVVPTVLPTASPADLLTILTSLAPLLPVGYLPR